MENCVEREGYALAAGLALGLVCLRAGARAHLAHLAPRLRTYMLGGDRRGLSGPCASLLLLKCYIVLENSISSRQIR